MSRSILAGDTVESNSFINVIDGTLSLNFGNIDIPAGWHNSIEYFPLIIQGVPKVAFRPFCFITKPPFNFF